MNVTSYVFERKSIFCHILGRLVGRGFRSVQHPIVRLGWTPRHTALDEVTTVPVDHAAIIRSMRVNQGLPALSDENLITQGDRDAFDAMVIRLQNP